MYFLLGMGIFHCYVSLPEGITLVALPKVHPTGWLPRRVSKTSRFYGWWGHGSAIGSSVKSGGLPTGFWRFLPSETCGVKQQLFPMIRDFFDKSHSVFFCKAVLSDRKSLKKSWYLYSPRAWWACSKSLRLLLEYAECTRSCEYRAHDGSHVCFM